MQELFTFAVGSPQEYTPERQAITVIPLFAKTSTADSGRNQMGVANNKVMFTVQAYKLTFPTLYTNDMSGILQAVLYNNPINFHYFNPVFGEWRTEQFYVENIDTSGVYVEDGIEKLFGLNFQITAINPL